MDRGIIIPVAGMLMVVVLAIGVPLVRAFVKRWERQPVGSPLPPEIGNRLERIEQAVESIAVEVERISEGQRFTTRLLSERTDEPVPVRAPAERASR